MRLTVAIPTYNRNALLNETLQRLLPQLSDKCRLLIVDNCSDVPVADTVADLVSGFPEADFRIVRNPTNVGGAANILRCIELCDTEWIWILGDDDNVSDDAVSLVSKYLEQHSECMFFNFSSPSYTREMTFFSKGQSEFIEKFDSFSNVLFTPACVFKVPAVTGALKFGYNYSYSMAPQVAILLMSLGGDGVCCFSSDRIVDKYMCAPIEDYWAPTVAMIGRMTLLDLPIPNQLKRILGEKIRRKPGLEYVVTNLTVRAHRMDRDDALYLYDHICYRQYYYGAGVSLRLKVMLYRMLIRYPRFGYRLLSLVYGMLTRFAGYKGPKLEDMCVGNQLHRL